MRLCLSLMIVLNILLSHQLRAETQSHRLTMLTVNTALLPVRLGFYSTPARGVKLAEKLLELDDRLHIDVICTQELFEHYVRVKIMNRLKERYPYQYVDQRYGRNLIGVNSGLAIFSKYPINRGMIHDYDEFRGEENFSRKGVMGVELQIAPDKRVGVFTTHLQAGGGAAFFRIFDYHKPSIANSEIDLLQLKQAKAHIDNFISKGEQPLDGYLFAGDFNICYQMELPIYKRAMDILAPVEDKFTLNPLNPDDTSLDSTVWEENGSVALNDRIDYIFAIIHPELIEGDAHPIREIDSTITDHLAVLGHFTVL